MGLTPRPKGQWARPSLGSASSLSPLGSGGRPAARRDAQLLWLPRPGLETRREGFLRESSLPLAWMAPQKMSKAETDRTEDTGTRPQNEELKLRGEGAPRQGRAGQDEWRVWTPQS